MFNRPKTRNVVDLNGDPINRSYPVDNAVRFVGRMVHKTVRRVVVKAYWWNKLADCR